MGNSRNKKESYLIIGGKKTTTTPSRSKCIIHSLTAGQAGLDALTGFCDGS